MKANYIIVRFGELTTKGKNRKLFTRKLLSNIKEQLRDYKSINYDLKYDRLYIILDNHEESEIIDKLSKIFGIHSFSMGYKVPKDIEEAKKVALMLIEKSDAKTFKVNAKRSDKTYPGTSIEINKEIATYIFKNTKRALSVDVHKPELLITVEIKLDAMYVMDNSIPGAGGYPVGIGDKGLLMLSGGIDSPVAGYLTLKRGVDIECIHFAAPPYTSEQAKNKVFDLVEKLIPYSTGKIKVHIINFTKLQLAVYDSCDESYAMTVMRRMMYRISERLATQINAKALVNGESIGQVASQTLQSIATINEVINMPVIRPVACLDKLEIIEIANKIDTFEISTRPYEDCCTIFTPKKPATKPKNYVARKYEDEFEWKSLIDECLETREVLEIPRAEEYLDIF